MKTEEIVRYDYSLIRIIRMFFLVIQSWPIWPSKIRCHFLKLGGVKIETPCFIGANVSFDTLRPSYISIGERTVITSGTKIITHFFSPSDGYYYYGRVNIGKGCFLGTNTLIVNSVDIGDNSVIGAGSVVTKDIPPAEIWAGNPARLIKKREV